MRVSHHASQKTGALYFFLRFAHSDVHASNEAFQFFDFPRGSRQIVLYCAHRTPVINLYMIPPSSLVLLQGWGLIDLLLRASNEGLLRPRVARAQKIISLHPLRILRARRTVCLLPRLIRSHVLRGHRESADLPLFLFGLLSPALEGQSP